MKTALFIATMSYTSADTVNIELPNFLPENGGICTSTDECKDNSEFPVCIGISRKTGEMDWTPESSKFCNKPAVCNTEISAG